MQLEVFCLCKSILTNIRGQHTIIDVFDTHSAEGEPVLIESFSLALQLRLYQSEDVGEHRFVVVFKDSVGTVLFPPITEIFSTIKLPESSTMVFYTYVTPRLVLRFGEYEFSIEADGKRIGRTPLYVVRAKARSVPIL